MFHAAKTGNGSADCLCVDTGKIGDGCSRQNIFQIMGADDFQILFAADIRHFSCFPFDDDAIVFEKSAKVKLTLSAERHDLGFTARRQFVAALIVIVDNQITVSALVGEDLSLSVTVSLHSMVPVEMVRRQIENGRYHRFKILRGLQLETAGLCHQPIVFSSINRCGYDCHADVSNYISLPSGIFKYLTHQGGSSSFPVSTRDGNVISAADPIGNLQLSDNLCALLFRFRNER